MYSLYTKCIKFIYNRIKCEHIIHMSYVYCTYHMFILTILNMVKILNFKPF